MAPDQNDPCDCGDPDCGDQHPRSITGRIQAAAGFLIDFIEYLPDETWDALVAAKENADRDTPVPEHQNDDEPGITMRIQQCAGYLVHFIERLPESTWNDLAAAKQNEDRRRTSRSN